MDIHLINETRNVKIAKLKTAYTVFVHCNLVNNYKPCELTFFHIYIYIDLHQIKLFGKLLEIKLSSATFLKTFRYMFLTSLIH